MSLKFMPHYPLPQCGAWRAKSGKVRCELPPNHDWYHFPRERLHLGRDRAGRYHKWEKDARNA